MSGAADGQDGNGLQLFFFSLWPCVLEGEGEGGEGGGGEGGRGEGGRRGVTTEFQ